MWQMAAVLEFLHTFSMHLQLRGSFTPEELEVAIVSEVAQTGLLAILHQVQLLASESIGTAVYIKQICHKCIKHVKQSAPHVLGELHAAVTD